MMKESAAFAAIVIAAAALGGCGGQKTGEEEKPAAAAPESAPAETAMTDSSATAKEPARSLTPEMTTPADAPLGKRVFDKNCAACHAPGEDHPGTMQLGVKKGAEYAVLEQRDDLTAEYVKYIVRHGLNAMPPFKPSSVTKEDLDALADYLGKGK